MCTSSPKAPPPPPPPAPPAPVAPPTRIAPAGATPNEDIQKRSRGTAALRIDRAGINVGAMGSGLNIVT